MNSVTTRIASLATLALAALPVLAMAGAVHAEDHRIAVGDLSSPAQAAAFNHRLDAVARSMCDSYSHGVARVTDYKACQSAVREEAMDALTAGQRDQLAANTAANVRVARMGR